MIAEGAGEFVLAALGEEVLGVGEVRGHELRGELGVAGFDGGEDRAVEGHGVLEVDHLRGDHHHVEHGAVDGVEDASGEPVSGGLEDGAMEEEIGGDKLDAILLGVFEVGDGLAQECDVLGVGALGGGGGERRLHEETQLGEFLDGGVVEEEEEVHGYGEDGGRVAVEVAAVSDFLGDDAHDLQDLQGLSERRARHLEVGGEVALGGQFGAG